MGLQIEVTPDTLIPRPETEQIIEEVLKRAGNAPVILDLCTGSGCVAVTTAVLLPRSVLAATDISKKALEVAKRNAAFHNIDTRIEFLSGDLFKSLKGCGKIDIEAGFDFILSNPPYIKTADLPGLQSEVIGYEPRPALDGGTDGLDCVRVIIKEAPRYLKPGAELIMEIGFDLAQEVSGLLKASAKYSGFDIKKDLNGIERVVVATRS